MQANITAKLRDFWDANIRGPDFVWAATGPALEAFSKHPVVKRTDAPGSVLTVAEFLRHVRRMVVAFVVNRLFAVQGEATATLDDPTTTDSGSKTRLNPGTAAPSRRPRRTHQRRQPATPHRLPPPHDAPVEDRSRAAWTATWKPKACGATTCSSRWCRRCWNSPGRAPTSVLRLSTSRTTWQRTVGWWCQGSGGCWTSSHAHVRLKYRHLAVVVGTSSPCKGRNSRRRTVI